MVKVIRFVLRDHMDTREGTLGGYKIRDLRSVPVPCRWDPQ